MIGETVREVLTVTRRRDEVVIRPAVFGVAELVPVGWLGASFELPVLRSVDVPSLVLSLAAAAAIFRFKLGIMPVLLASSLAGILYAVVLSH